MYEETSGKRERSTELDYRCGLRVQVTANCYVSRVNQSTSDRPASIATCGSENSGALCMSVTTNADLWPQPHPLSAAAVTLARKSHILCKLC